MRGMVILLLAFVVTLPASADVVSLRSGRKVEGTLEAIVFFAQGKNTDYDRSAFSDLVLGESSDEMVLNDGRRLAGIISVFKVHTIGGVISCARQDVLTLELTEDPLSGARQALAERRETVAGDDDAALFELAVWCQKQGLNREAAQLAQECLDVNPLGSYVNDAHRLLGHVYYRSQWMTVPEMLKLDPNAVPEEPPSPDDFLPPDEEQEPVTPPSEAEIAAATARNDELLKEATAKLKELTAGALAEIDAAFQKQDEEITELLKKHAILLLETESALATNKRQPRVIVRGGQKYWSPHKPALDAERKHLEADIKRLTSEITELRTAKSNIPWRKRLDSDIVTNRSATITQRMQRTNNVYLEKFRRGGIIADEKMESAYEKLVATFRPPPATKMTSLVDKYRVARAGAAAQPPAAGAPAGTPQAPDASTGTTPQEPPIATPVGPDGMHAPVAQTGALVHGAKASLYRGVWQTMPDFNTLQPTVTAVTNVMNTSVCVGVSEHFGLKFTGYIRVPSDGVYRFSTISDDGSRLWVSNQLLVDNAESRVEKSASIGLKAGLHPITVWYYQGVGTALLTVYFEGPGVVKRELQPTDLFADAPPPAPQ